MSPIKRKRQKHKCKPRNTWGPGSLFFQPAKLHQRSLIQDVELYEHSGTVFYLDWEHYAGQANKMQTRQKRQKPRSVGCSLFMFTEYRRLSVPCCTLTLSVLSVETVILLGLPQFSPLYTTIILALVSSGFGCYLAVPINSKRERS